MSQVTFWEITPSGHHQVLGAGDQAGEVLHLPGAQIRVEPLIEELHLLLKATLRAAVKLLHLWLNLDLSPMEVQDLTCLIVSTKDLMVARWGDHPCGPARLQLGAV